MCIYLSGFISTAGGHLYESHEIGVLVEVFMSSLL